MRETSGEEHRAQAAQHRGDIAGMRAIAVAGVLLFHVGGSDGGWGVARGGFAGVDIFLVISGYLITGNLLRARAAGQFTLMGFYARRIVRIVPVLTVVVLATLGYAMLALLPVEISRVGKSAAATAASVSNFYFNATTGYFATAGEAQPLLHSWSLGVEEQFYLFHPLLLLWLTRRGWAPRPMLLGIGVASFALGTVQAFHQPAAGFYLLPARAWELALGAWLAAGGVRMRADRSGEGWWPRTWWAGNWVREAASAAGVAMMLLALVMLKPDLPFPAPTALLPCVGAALVLGCGAGTRAGTLLGSRSLRWLGMISYSVYLWHWPIVTFYRLRFGLTLGVAEAAMLVAVSVVVGALSFYLVERPAMRRWRSASPAGVIAAALAVAAALVTLGLGAGATAGWLRPVRPAVSALASFVDYERSAVGRAQFRRGTCFVTDNAPGFDAARCLARRPGRRALLVIGDSYAAQYWRSIAERFPDADVMQATAAGCRPLIEARGAARCTALMRHVFADLVAHRQVEAVVLAGRWLASEDAALARTIAFIRAHGVAVTVVGPAVEYDGSVPLLLARAVQAGNARGIDRFRRHGARRERAIRAIALAAGANYYSVTLRECPRSACRLLAAPGVPIHFDEGHVTQAAARQLMRDFGWPS
ncbi:acyltransferase [Sphingomonas sp. HHU CXW]|uniref:Acyltransferase n=1 Tax=Sphingomonas hominis TaxID=2741495 RepID=A0ABX2JN51_9SPHN|nr:acyltransferase family protein [Sphingomonas hominis]NTS65882.1 acyltransferase [Sphingomonas hominis]